MTALLRTVTSALAACVALAAASCGTVRATSAWLAAPVLQTADPDLRLTEDCRDQRPLVPPAQTDRRIRIGAWNMLYLGPSEKTPHEKRDPRQLAAYVRLAGVSVLALEEIGVQSAEGRPRNATLDAMFAELNRSGADWTYLLHGTEKDKNQFVGLAWDRRVMTQVADPMPLDLTADGPGAIPLLSFVHTPMDTKLWIHPPFAVKLSAGPGLTDIVFVPVHLTARVETWLFEDATAHREDESRSLARTLPEVVRHFRDKDVVVLGDFNVELGTEKVAEAINACGWRDLNCAKLATYEWGMPLDRIFVPRDQPEFGLDPNFARVIPPDTSAWDVFEHRYSDHVMVVADVLVTRDDD
jgi:hypothetical protein